MRAKIAEDPTDTLSARVPWIRNKKLDQWICFWTMPVFWGLFGIVFVPLTWINPPRSPAMSLEGIVAFMQSPNLLIAASILSLCNGLLILTYAIVATQMRRMKGISPALSYALLAAMVIGSVVGSIVPMFYFALGSFRAQYSPQILALLYDMGFLSFIASLGCFCTMYLVFAIAVLLDKSGLFPKWLAYYSVWNYVTELVAGGSWITKTGPFAWDGLLTFWLGVAIFVSWEICLCVYLYRAIKNQPSDERIAA